MGLFEKGDRTLFMKKYRVDVWLVSGINYQGWMVDDVIFFGDDITITDGDSKTYIYKRNVCLLMVTPTDEENNDEELFK